MNYLESFKTKEIGELLDDEVSNLNDTIINISYWEKKQFRYTKKDLIKVFGSIVKVLQ